MMINAISGAYTSASNLQPQVKEKNKKAVVSNPVEKIRPWLIEKNDESAFKSYILGGINVKSGKKKPDPIKNYINSLPFADELSPEDKRNLGNVLRKQDEETDYMKKMIHLVCKEMVAPAATASLCKHGVMSDLVKEDIDIYYDKVKKQKMSVKDAFVPMHNSKEEGQNSSKVGDVFRVDGEDKIYVKSGDNSSQQLKMDADTYLKLYPPVSRYASAQGATGDCYLLSTINAIMENPYSRASIYNCFTQDGKDVIMQLPAGRAKVVCPDGKLPKGSDYSKYTDGPMGMKLLEHMYGQELKEEKYEEYNNLVNKEFEKMDKDLKKWETKKIQDNLSQKKQREIKARIANWHKGQEEVMKTKDDPSNNKVFLLDDNLDFVIGKFGPMMEEVDKVDSEYMNPAEFYCGAYGGLAEPVLEDFGYEHMTLLPGKNKKELDKVLFAKNPNDYIIAAGTHAEQEGEMESPQEVAYSIYSSHEYKVLPFDDENGNRMFRVTNPWNQSHQVIMDAEKLKEFFEDFSVSKVNKEA